MPSSTVSFQRNTTQTRSSIDSCLTVGRKVAASAAQIEVLQNAQKFVEAGGSFVLPGYGAYKAIYGENMWGEKLSVEERIVEGVGVLAGPLSAGTQFV